MVVMLAQSSEVMDPGVIMSRVQHGRAERGCYVKVQLGTRTITWY